MIAVYIGFLCCIHHTSLLNNSLMSCKFSGFGMIVVVFVKYDPVKCDVAQICSFLPKF